MKKYIWFLVCVIFTLSLVTPVGQAASNHALVDTLINHSSMDVANYWKSSKTDNRSSFLSPEDYTVVKHETFEGSFPNSGWTVTDLSNDGYERNWDDDNYKHSVGNWAAWPTRGGTDGYDPSPTNHYYF